ncbi:MAG: hypothetical protein NC321_15445 [Clostridium sp.]|nr:hypothetical protein [Clostridium sp.]
MEKLMLEMNQDIDRYKEEMISEAAGGYTPHLRDIEPQESGQILVEAQEAALTIRAIEWMTELERCAVKQELTLDNLYAIEECKKQITAENVNWSDIHSTVEKMLESIGRELIPDNGESDEGMKAASIQAFKLQVQKTMDTCHAENESTMDFMTERESAVVKRVYGNIQKVSAVKTSFAERKNRNSYTEIFINIKKEFDKAAALLLRELLKSVAQNYDQVLEEMKKMFQSIGEYLFEKENESEKLYREYEARKNKLYKEMSDKAETLEFGGNEITAFGNKTSDMVKSIGKKWDKKRKVLVMLPMFMLICSFLFEAIIAQGQISGAVENTKAGGFLMEFDDMIRTTIPWSAVNDFIYYVVAFVVMLFYNLKSFLIFTVLLVIALYAGYLKLLKLWCGSQMCRQCEEYLKIELAQFKHNNTLMPRMEEVLKKAIEEYEQKNRVALESIFSAIESNSIDDERTDITWFVDMKEQWDKITCAYSTPS